MKRLSSRLFTIAVILAGALGIIYHKEAFSYVTSTKLPLRAHIALWVGELLWIGGFLFLIFGQRLIRKKWRELTVFGLTLVIGLACVEIALRMIGQRPPRFSRHHYLNYIGKPNYRSSDGVKQHNSLGFRGPEIVTPKPRGVYRLAILGGSSVYEEYVKDWRKDFARQLERELQTLYAYQGIEVINAGLPGWSSWEDLVNLQFRLLDLDLDMIIVYDGTNDVHARLVNPKAYKADNSGWHKQWEDSLCLHPLCFHTIQRLTGLEMQGFAVEAVTFGATEEVGYSPTLAGTPLETLRKNPPVFYERNLRNIIAIAQEHGIKILLATWAYSDKFNDYASTAHYQLGFKEINEVTKRVGQMKGVVVFDFASVMPKDKRFWVDGRHNNEEGAKVKGEMFAKFIFEQRLIDVTNILSKSKRIVE